MIRDDLSVDVLVALSGKGYPRLHEIGETCPFLRYYHSIELSDILSSDYDKEKDEENKEDIA